MGGPLATPSPIAPWRQSGQGLSYRHGASLVGTYEPQAALQVLGPFVASAPAATVRVSWGVHLARPSTADYVESYAREGEGT